jgi:hypothetical protein|tara:strand:+ start:452 stop:1441 length:990 start_codon:yes stop_codon:yes gene_type:complete
MFNTKNLVLQEENIPSYWVFQYYLNLPEPLTGQDIKLTSIFNPNEKTPSFCIYVDKNIKQYKFKDFSTGHGGNKIELVKMLFSLNYSSACMRIIDDYNKYIKTNGFEEIDFKPAAKWKVDFVKTRLWNETDSAYWLSFRIGMTILTEFNVKPIEYYNLVKSESDQIKALKIEGKRLYGYFDKNEEVYKIYQPASSKHKFHKVKSYLQGYDQLKFNQPYLVICSSLKDALCLKGIGYNIEVIAPDSENTMIKAYVIEHLKKKYKKVITLFDNDEAGRNAIEKYANAYKINGFTLNICKDISDAMKEHGFDKVHAHLKPLLKMALNKQYGK